MTTTFEAALKQAGVSVPSQQERVWRVIKDHPGITAKRISSITKIDQSQVSSYCSVMLARKMLEVTYVPMHMRLGRGHGMKNVSTFKVTQQKYEVLPKVEAEKEVIKGKGQCSEVKIIHPEAPVQQQKAPQIAKRESEEHWKADVEAMTVAEARALYNVLHKMFGTN